MGVQIIGPRFREDLVLDAAEVIEARCPPMTPIDPRNLERRLQRTLRKRNACPGARVDSG
jgi:hypothetical protein